jgi:hypothetical protein
MDLTDQTRTQWETVAQAAVGEVRKPGRPPRRLPWPRTVLSGLATWPRRLASGILEFGPSMRASLEIPTMTIGILGPSLQSEVLAIEGSYRDSG